MFNCKSCTICVVLGRTICTTLDRSLHIHVTSRHLNCRWPPTDLRNDNWYSKAMATGFWDKPINQLDIPYYEEITVLVFGYTSTLARSGNFTWSRATDQVKALTGDAKVRDLRLTQRIQYMRILLLSKIWHTEQIFPTQKETSDNSYLSISWYIWRGANVGLHACPAKSNGSLEWQAW